MQAVTLMGVGGGKVNNLFIHQIFIDCLSKVGHCTVRTFLVLTLNTVALGYILSTLCVYLVCILCVFYPWGAFLCVYVGMYTHVCVCTTGSTGWVRSIHSSTT